MDLSGRRDPPHRGAFDRADRPGARSADPRAVRSRRRALAAPAPRGAARSTCEPPENFVSLGRTIGIPANGAVSNLTVRPTAVLALRRELRDGGYDVRTSTSRSCRWSAGTRSCPRASCRSWARFTPTPTTRSPTDRRGRVRRALAHEPSARAHRRVGGGGVDGEALLRRALPDRAQRGLAGAVRDEPVGAQSSVAWTGDTGCADSTNDDPLRILFIGQAVERKGLPVLLRAFEALREHVPATLTLVGASRRGDRADAARRPRRARAGQGLRGAQARRAGAAPTCCARPRCAARASAWS